MIGDWLNRNIYVCGAWISGLFDLQGMTYIRLTLAKMLDRRLHSVQVLISIVEFVVDVARRSGRDG